MQTMTTHSSTPRRWCLALLALFLTCALAWPVATSAWHTMNQAGAGHGLSPEQELEEYARGHPVAGPAPQPPSDTHGCGSQLEGFIREVIDDERRHYITLAQELARLGRTPEPFAVDLVQDIYAHGNLSINQHVQTWTARCVQRQQQDPSWTSTRVRFVAPAPKPPPPPHLRQDTMGSSG